MQSDKFSIWLKQFSDIHRKRPPAFCPFSVDGLYFMIHVIKSVRNCLKSFRNRSIYTKKFHISKQGLIILPVYDWFCIHYSTLWPYLKKTISNNNFIDIYGYLTDFNATHVHYFLQVTKCQQWYKKTYAFGAHCVCICRGKHGKHDSSPVRDLRLKTRKIRDLALFSHYRLEMFWNDQKNILTCFSEIKECRQIFPWLWITVRFHCWTSKVEVKRWTTAIFFFRHLWLFD